MRQSPPMRRKDRALDTKATMDILQAGSFGVLASADIDGLPLATPLSYVIMDGALYFHCAKTGHKLDNLAARPEACFCVVTEDNPVFAKDFTTLYKSALVHGTTTLVDDPAEHRAALLALCRKYLPQHMGEAELSVQKSGRATAVVRISLDEVVGKSNAGG